MSVVILHLIRHGASVPNPAAPAQDWPLSDSARAGIEQLASAGTLPADARWFSSPEAKAIGTARMLHTGDVQVIADLREAERSAVWFEDQAEFEATVERAFATPNAVVVQGWEPLATTRTRVTAAVRSLLAGTEEGGDAVMVGHGTAWTLLVAELTSREPDVASWRSMTMPDHFALDLDSCRVISAWGTARSQ